MESKIGAGRSKSGGASLARARLKAAIRLLSHAASDRAVGLLEGEITADRARAMFDPYADAGEGFDQDLIDDLLARIAR